MCGTPLDADRVRAGSVLLVLDLTKSSANCSEKGFKSGKSQNIQVLLKLSAAQRPSVKDEVSRQDGSVPPHVT